MSHYDEPWKEALEVYFEAFVQFFFPAMHADIDWNRKPEFLDKELEKITPQAETGKGFVDKLVKVWRKSGAEEWVLVHIEVQSQPDKDFAKRMYLYNVRLFERYDRKVVSLAVLGDDVYSWRPNSFEYELWGCKVSLVFPIVKLLDYNAQWDVLEQSTNPFATIVMAHLKSMETKNDPADRLTWKWTLVRSLYERGFDKEDVRLLFKFIDWMMDLPPALEKILDDDLTNYQEKAKMPYVSFSERVAAHRLHQGIEATLDVKFGEEGIQLMPEIREIIDHDKLESILHAIKPAKTLDELRSLWQDNDGNT